MLALKTAMASAFKAKNFINAAGFAKRLLELPDVNSERHADTRTKAQKVLQKSEQPVTATMTQFVHARVHTAQCLDSRQHRPR